MNITHWSAEKSQTCNNNPLLSKVSFQSLLFPLFAYSRFNFILGHQYKNFEENLRKENEKMRKGSKDEACSQGEAYLQFSWASLPKPHRRDSARKGNISYRRGSAFTLSSLWETCSCARVLPKSERGTQITRRLRMSSQIFLFFTICVYTSYTKAFYSYARELLNQFLLSS